MNIKFFVEFIKKDKRWKKTIVCGSMEMLEKALKTKANEKFFGYEDETITFTFEERKPHKNGTSKLYNVFLNGNFCGTLFTPFSRLGNKFYIAFERHEVI